MTATAEEAGSPLPGIVLERTYHAPRAAGWRAFTEAAALESWWGTHDQPATAAEVELKSGGRVRIDRGGSGGALPMIVSRFESLDDRAGMIASGMSYGVQTTFDRLAEYLASM